MADVNRGNRPLSPHLSVYRMSQINTVTSILNRITGAGLLVAFGLLAWWFVAAATGQGAFDPINGLLSSFLGKLILLGSLWALWFHFLGGIKHLIMDTGRGFDLKTSDRISWGVLIGSVLLTLLSICWL